MLQGLYIFSGKVKHRPPVKWLRSPLMMPVKEVVLMAEVSKEIKAEPDTEVAVAAVAVVRVAIVIW
jgi:hypothetical protein